jgi:beta-lactamase class A
MNSPSIARRTVLTGALMALPSLAFADEAAIAFDALERRHGGQLGIAALDTGTNRRLAHRADERFPMCSTFKILAAGLVLTRADRGEESLDRRVLYAPSDLVAYSPETQKHADGRGMTMGEICAAAITLSDNTAGNLMLASFGGPSALTAFARRLEDGVTRLDRNETSLNEALPGDPRDTTSPRAMLSNLHRLLLGMDLSEIARAQLTAWMVANTTGATRLRAGFPTSWRVGDKTGTGNHGTANVVAIVWPPGRLPVLAAVYYKESQASNGARNTVIADVGRVIAATFA